MLPLNSKRGLGESLFKVRLAHWFYGKSRQLLCETARVRFPPESDFFAYSMFVMINAPMTSLTLNRLEKSDGTT